jgi:hypothetical protein
VTEHEFLLKIAANQSIKKRKKKINLKRNWKIYINIRPHPRLTVFYYNSSSQQPTHSTQGRFFFSFSASSKHRTKKKEPLNIDTCTHKSSCIGYTIAHSIYNIPRSGDGSMSIKKVVWARPIQKKTTTLGHRKLKKSQRKNIKIKKTHTNRMWCIM